ncbi:hypothetical protein FZC76_04705 [Sutcliffiella horikoshii]|uniref:Uncharacterized protein n=1 Tax=Sutcliffiella horikoshii TaxID=79883 RepID=A0A5D4T2P0_9BACI|nr:hypothetical protein [Sutcliffiella horikoshii]TYS69539.1 hypothetical protein FZC76_04705 [Sutcliffiella horikoshii]
MMKNTNEHRWIKESLEKDVFSKYQYRTRKAEIIEKATSIKRVSKKRTYYHYVLSTVALILFSIISVSYMMANQSKPDSTPQAVQKEEISNTQNHNQIMEDKEIPLDPKDEQRNEDSVKDTNKDDKPLKVQRTEEEWKAYFQSIYNSTQESIQKLKLVYQFNNSSSDNSELEITANFEGDDFVVIENIVSEMNEEITTNQTNISTKDEYILLDHLNKIYDQEFFSPISAAEFRKNRPLFNGNPLYQLSKEEFEGYKWTEVEQNMEENWVKFEFIKTDQKIFFYDKGIIKVKYDTGTILERTTYIAEEIDSYFFLKELKINDEVTQLQMDKSIPSDYVSREQAKTQEKRVIVESSWFDKAGETVMKKHPQIQEIHSTGEGDLLFVAIDMKEGTTTAEGQKAGQAFFDQFTAIANASSSFQERSTTIWADGQYGIHINVRIPKDASIYGKELNGQVTWEKKPNSENTN